MLRLQILEAHAIRRGAWLQSRPGAIAVRLVSAASFLSLALISGVGMARANDIYLAQSAVGNGTGSNCANALAASFFNTSGNWTSTTPSGTSIGGGSTVHLCGTLTSALTFQGSGSASAPVTLLFESGAQMSAPNWGSGTAAITGNGIGYITIDGGSNGLIQSTSNGTALATQVDTNGITLYNCSNCTVRNLTIANMYVHTYNLADDQGQNTGGIYVQGGNNVALYNNVVHDMKWCLEYSFSGVPYSNISIYGNTAYHCDHGVTVGSGNTGATVDGVSVYGNTIYDGYLWDNTDNDNHHDGIHVWAVHDASVISNLKVYDNYIYGNWGVSVNAFIYMEAESTGTETNSLAFNNLLIDTTTLSHYGCGYLCVMGASSGVYNNTVVGQSTASGVGISIYGNNDSIENNIMSTMAQATYISLGSGAAIQKWDYNDYYNVGPNAWNGGSPFSAWQGYCDAVICNPDTHGSLANPNLNAAGSPSSSSSALIKKGVNLSALSVTQLDADRLGTPRPALPTNWDVGAAQYQANRVLPPTALMLTVH